MQRLTTIIKEAIHKHDTQLQLSSCILENEIYHAIKLVMRENPDIFWFSHQWNYSEADNILHLHYTLDIERCEKIKVQIADVVGLDFNISYARSLPTMEQVMYVYKWIALYCNYNIYSAHNQTIYSVFIHRNSVCTGIAKATQYLLGLLGIESKLVFGKLNNSHADSRHCWLVVKIRENWYHIDPTFAIPETSEIICASGVSAIKGADDLFYNYFCVDAETIKQNRTIEDENSLPICLNTIDFKKYQYIKVTPSRNGENGGLGCLLSDNGTTADIYLAHNNFMYSRHRSVAKVFCNDDDHEVLRKELVVMRKCAGPHLLRATDVDFDKGILYIEQATPLSELLNSHYFCLSVEDFCNLLIDVASGLNELLNHGILYRDIHLNNIYLSNTKINGRYIYKLGDFGSCSFVDGYSQYENLTEKGGIGSKWYMAPETLEYGIFDERSAVYGVGMIAYYLLNDLYPPLWQDYGEEAISQRMKFSILSKPSLLDKCSFIHLDFSFIDKALRNDVSQRQQTLDELLEDIAEFLSDNTTSEETILIEGASFNQNVKNTKTNIFCSTCGADPNIKVSNGDADNISSVYIDKEDCSLRIDDFASTSISFCESIEPQQSNNISNQTFCPQKQSSNEQYPNEQFHSVESTQGDFFEKLINLFLGKVKKQEHNNKLQKVYSSIFAPSEIKRNDYMMVQVFLYKEGEERYVASKANEVDPDAERKNYTPLLVELKKGDKVKISLQVSNKDIQVEDSVQEITWQGRITDCQFAMYISNEFNASTLLATVVLSVNGAPVGRMMFKTKVVGNPRKLHTEIVSRSFHKIFISYSHKDESRVKYLAEAYKAQGVDYFFDRHYLKAGDVYPLKIQQYIDSADLFILCWSKNAAESDYVTLERNRAMSHAYPQVTMDKASITIHPISIKPRAAFPQDMDSIYNFEEV